MNHIRNLISDSDLDIELLKNIKDRKFDQKHLYTTEEGAFYYCDQSTSGNRPYHGESLGASQYAEFFTKYMLEKKKCVLISLGCGDASVERDIFSKVNLVENQLVYIGVDSSKHMLNMASKNLAGINIEKHYICADFSANNFRSEIKHIIDGYENRVFTLLGDTVGNIMPTNIADTLMNILNKDDLLWLTIVLRRGKTKEDDFLAFQNYSKYIQEGNTIRKFLINLPYSLGISNDDGKLVLDMEEEKATGALIFKFSFEIKKKTIIKLRGESIVLLPEEKIELISVRVYDPSTFEKFFSQHQLKLVAKERGGNRGQFLFKKK
jgi:hypothetical protein